MAIIFPKDWRQLGTPVTILDIDNALRQVIGEINSCNISFSGGVDSCLLLFYLMEIKGKANAFTVANNTAHPDIHYSKRAIYYFEQRYKVKIQHKLMILPKQNGDDLVRAYYESLTNILQDIITGDVIDELSCGYYAHQNLEEETYQDYLNRLQLDHLQPLNSNSGNVKVYLPYADDRITNLFYRIPLYQKVSSIERKLVIMQLAKDKVPSGSIKRRKYGLGTDR